MSFTICYDWEDLDAPESEQKFGDHFSEACTLEDAFAETKKYIRSSLGRQKHKFDEGRIKIHHMWDVTEYAKSKNRFGKHQKVDDIIRPVIGHHIGADVHRIDADILIVRVNKELNKSTQPRPILGLAQWQFDAADNILSAITEGKRTMLAEECARFGKTTWAGALVIETNVRVTVIASYILTSFASFAKDLTEFEQFRNLVIIDSADENYKEEIATALAQNLQVVVFISMCGGSKRQDRIDHIFSLPHKRLVFIDEADFGAHTAKQSDPLIAARDINDVVILMTGTNGDRACGNWTTVMDHYLGTTYAELLMEKAGI